MYLFIFKYIYRIFRTIFCSSRMLKCQDGRIASHAWACCDFCQHSPRPWSVGIARYNHYLLVELVTNMKHNRETMGENTNKIQVLGRFSRIGWRCKGFYDSNWWRMRSFLRIWAALGLNRDFKIHGHNVPDFRLQVMCYLQDVDRRWRDKMGTDMDSCLGHLVHKHCPLNILKQPIERKKKKSKQVPSLKILR